MAKLTILFPNDGESWSAFARRAKQEKGEILIVTGPYDEILVRDQKERDLFCKELKSINDRLLIATRKPAVKGAARAQGIRVIDSMSDFKQMIAGHPNKDEALRLFSPHIWRQKLRSRLQEMGLLSLPKLRIWALIVLSALLFLFVFFKLLPSAEVRVWPRGDTITQTANIFLVQSGATVDIPPRVRKIELKPIVVKVNKSITFDQISKEFIGQSSRVPMTVINKSNEKYSLRVGTRVMNQAGMIFRLEDPVNIEPGEELTVRSIADDLDLYGEIIGDRGNVPAGVRWDFPGLAREEQIYIYAENREEARGGTTSHRTVLHQEDIDVARTKLEQDLLAEAKQLVEEEKDLFNSESNGQILELLYYDELTKSTYSGFVLPTQFLGQAVQSVPIQGQIIYTAYGYDNAFVLDLLTNGLYSHVSDGMRLISDSIGMDRLVAHVIDYEDDLSSIKITVDLSGTERFVLDPLSPAGAHFAKRLRESIKGKSKADALNIVKNFPEVDNAEISMWPPWSRTLPNIPSHISIEPMVEYLHDTQ